MGGRCQKARHTESPLQDDPSPVWFTYLCSLYSPQCMVCSDASWLQGSMGFVWCGHDPTWKPKCAELCCWQRLPRQAHGACSSLLLFLLPACKIFQQFSTSFVVYSADLCTKNSLCLLQWRGHLESTCRYSLAPGEALAANRVLNSLEHPLCLWVAPR